VIESALAEIEREGIAVEIDEAKKTSGGYFSILRFSGGEYRSQIQLEVSLRKAEKSTGTAALISSDFIPAFTLMHLDEKTVVKEKVNALLTRAKPRDFYDLYFILRGRMAFGSVFASDKTIKPKLLKQVKNTKSDLKNELKRFLPASQLVVLKDFKSILTSEIERSLP
jgi:predicted nucleotidyltransferase component of viral defense system